MAIMAIDFPALDNSFLRPVVFEVIRDIQKVMRFPTTDKIFFLDNGNDRPLQPGSAIGEELTSPTGHDSMLRVEVSEDYNSDYTLGSVSRINTDPFIFLDKILDIRILPIYTRTTITLSIKARFGSKSQAQAWRNGFRRVAQNFKKTLTHSVKYSFPVPKEMLLLLTHIYKLRESQSGYNETLKEYLLPRFVDRVQTLVDQAGNNPYLVISEMQTPVVGYFDFASEPQKADADTDRGVWEVSFDYKLYMERPISALMRYPITVHNLPVSKKFLHLHKRPVDDVTGYMTLLRQSLSPMIDSYPTVRSIFSGISIPYYDDWQPELIELDSLQIARILISVDPNDPSDVIDLQDLGDHAIHPLMLAYIRQYPDSIINGGKSFIKITPYIGDSYLAGNVLSITNDLKIRTASPMSLRETYHLVLSGLYDFALLSGEGLTRLIRHGELCLTYVEAIYPNIWKHLDKPSLLSDGSLGADEWERIARIVRRFFLKKYIDTKRIGRNVGLYFITSSKQEALDANP